MQLSSEKYTATLRKIYSLPSESLETRYLCAGTIDICGCRSLSCALIKSGQIIFIKNKQ